MSAKAFYSRVSLPGRHCRRARQRQSVHRLTRPQSRFLTYELLEDRCLLASIVNVNFEFTDPTGTTQVQSLNTGSDYQLQVYVQDARGNAAQGIEQAYFDISSNPLVTVNTPIDHGDYFRTGVEPNPFTGSLLDVGGVYAYGKPVSPHPAGDPFLLFSVPIHVGNTPGTLGYSCNVVSGPRASVDTVQMFDSLGAVTSFNLSGNVITVLANHVTPNLTTVADANVGTATFTLTTQFTQAMDTSVSPTISFPTANEDPTADGTLTLNAAPSQSKWLDNETYVAAYDVVDHNLNMPNIDVQVSGAKTASETTLGSFTVTDVFSVDMQNPTATIGFPVDGAWYNAAGWTGTISGTATDGSGSGVNLVQVSIQRNSDGKYWNGSGFNASGQTWQNATGTATWSYGNLTSDKLSDATTYIVHVQATDNAGNVQTIPSAATFGYDTDAPTSQITFPVDGNEYNAAGWQAITGTARDTGGSGLNKVQVSIQRDQDGRFWDGSGFNISSNGDEKWQDAQGTDNWSYDLPATALDNGDSYTIESAAWDNANNVESGQLPVAHFSYDTSAPTVTGLQANPVLIADAAVPSGFSLVVSYSEAMKAAPAPTITFSPDVSSTLHFTSGTWSADGKQYTANYSVTDAGVSVSGIGVSVSGAEDLAGNLQVSFSQPNVFSIDTQNPTVTGLQANPVLIADAAVPSGFSLVVSYSEAMKAAPAPTITFSPDVSSTLHFTSGTWSADGKQYTANYSVTDAGVSVSGIGVSVSGAEDLAGNLQVSFSQPNVFSIDTQNPTVTGLQANPVLIADAAVPSGFSLVVSYSEAMKAAPVPTITFTQDVSGTLHFTSGTWRPTGSSTRRTTALRTLG